MSRIINRQRQLAEQGRLRLGWTEPTANGKTKPVRSTTWVITSHSQEHIQNAANLWGGEVEHWQPMGNGAKQWRVITQASTIPAILPPGDPLTQANEMWNKGGCQRRCDGVTESFSGSPCLCLAAFGEQWYEQSARDVCMSKSRLKVLLPDMPGLGSWRMETGSFYATDEIAGIVDTIRGAVGDSVLIPVTLRIEPRTRVAGGQTKHFVVPVVELRGVTAGALLSGQAIETKALVSVEPIAAIESGPVAASLSDVDLESMDLDELREAWLVFRDEGTRGRIEARSRELHAQERVVDEPVDAVVVEELPADAPATELDADAVWEQILREAGKHGMSLPMIEADFVDRYALATSEASAGELAVYLKLLVTGEVAS